MDKELEKMRDDYILYDKITTTVTLNIWTLFRRSEKTKICLEYDIMNKEDNFLLSILFATRSLGNFTKVYLKMPFFKYLAYAFVNRKYKKVFAYSWTDKNKYMVEKERLLGDVKTAYEVNDDKIIEKIYDEFYGKEDKGNV